MNQKRKILFIYNANSNLLFAMSDMLHKIISPESYQCSLCKLTHGYFQSFPAWKAFIEQLKIPHQVLHKDEFESLYGQSNLALPAITEAIDGELKLLVTKEQLDQIKSLDELLTILKAALYS